MKTSSVFTLDRKLQSALLSTWTKLTASEVEEVIENHDKLPEFLVKRYSMSKNESQKKTENFFKPYEAKKKVVGQ